MTWKESLSHFMGDNQHFAEEYYNKEILEPALREVETFFKRYDHFVCELVITDRKEPQFGSWVKRSYLFTVRPKRNVPGFYFRLYFNFNSGTLTIKDQSEDTLAKLRNLFPPKNKEYTKRFQFHEYKLSTNDSEIIDKNFICSEVVYVFKKYYNYWKEKNNGEGPLTEFIDKKLI